MRITNTLGLAFLLVVAGCKEPTQSTQSPPNADGSSGVWPGTRMPQHAESAAAPSVSEWAKVKIGRSGEVLVNKKQMSLADFAVECERLKKVGGAVVLFIDTPNGVVSPAQTKAVQKIVDAGVPMNGVRKENELD